MALPGGRRGARYSRVNTGLAAVALFSRMSQIRLYSAGFPCQQEGVGLTDEAAAGDLLTHPLRMLREKAEAAARRLFLL